MSTYARAKHPMPIYNTPLFSHRQKTLPKDAQGLIKDIEIIAFTDTLFKCHQEVFPDVMQITTNEYPSTLLLYVDKRFLNEATDTSERKKELPSSDAIIEWMTSLLGTRYFWGGNWAQGIPEMFDTYSHLVSEDPQDILCKGVDCSGLLFQATDGITPRNTSQLLHYGEELLIDLFSLKAIQKILKPLDMIVWKGHVVFALNSRQFIESRLGAGVVITPFEQRYKEIFEKQPNHLTLRRWHPDLIFKK